MQHMAMWRCASAVAVIAVVADARTLRHQGAASEQAFREKCPCLALVQDNQAPTCPCLVTPAPLMTVEQTQAVEVKAAADSALMAGITRIQEAAKKAAEPLMKTLKDMDDKDIEKEAKSELESAEKKQSASLKMKLDAEKTRQVNEMAQMEAGANVEAQKSAIHIRETTEEWAVNQARNYIVLAANSPMSNALLIAKRTDKIRQEATELTKGAIDSAAQALDVAKKAQLAIDQVPKKRMVQAKKEAQGMEKEQQALNVEIEASEQSVRNIAKVAAEGYKLAQSALNEANEAESTAKEALSTSRSNAVKIEKLKTRAQAVSAKATKAEVELKKKQA